MQSLKLKDFPNYTLFSDGRVLVDKTGLFLKHGFDIHGYPYVGLWAGCKQKKKRIHRLLAENFVPGGASGLHVNHKNGVRSDFSLENLEWVTQKENCLHGYASNGRISARRKLRSEQIPCIFSLVGSGVSRVKVAKMFKVTPAAISFIISGKTYTKEGAACKL